LASFSTAALSARVMLRFTIPRVIIFKVLF
jgi:hypothetical protein